MKQTQTAITEFVYLFDSFVLVSFDSENLSVIVRVNYEDSLTYYHLLGDAFIWRDRLVFGKGACAYGHAGIFRKSPR